MKPNIELRIDELILRGVPYAQRRRIVAAIELELTRLIGEQGLPEAMTHGGALPQIELDELRGSDGMKPQVIGAQIARKIYVQFTGNRIQN